MENFYKLYIKRNGSYQPAEIYPSKKKLEQRLANIEEEYLLIHRHDEYDEILSHTEAKVKLVNNLQTKIKVNATTFTTEELIKKRKARKEERRKIQKEIDEWLDK